MQAKSTRCFNLRKAVPLGLTAAFSLAACGSGPGGPATADPNAASSHGAEVIATQSDPWDARELVQVAQNPELSTGGHCSLDTADGAVVLAGEIILAEPGATPLLAGWAADAETQAPTKGVLVFEGENRTYAIGLLFEVARPDVATALGNPEMDPPGFGTQVTLDGVEPGRYQLSIWLASGDDARRCDLEASIEVRR